MYVRACIYKTPSQSKSIHLYIHKVHTHIYKFFPYYYHLCVQRDVVAQTSHGSVALKEKISTSTNVVTTTCSCRSTRLLLAGDETYNTSITYYYHFDSLNLLLLCRTTFASTRQR